MLSLDEMIYDVFDHIPMNTYTKDKIFFVVLQMFRIDRKQLPNNHINF